MIYENILKDLTIVIPTYNSTHFLKRSLMYLSSFKLKLNIIVADSSREDNKLENEAIIKNTPHLHISHLKEFNPDIKPLLKWLRAIESAKTEYVVFCADDDFVSIKGLEKSLSFLRNNKDYSAVEGKNIYFVSFNFLGKCIFNWKNGDTWNSLEGKPMERLHEYAFNYQPLIYAVYKKKDIVRFFKLTEKNNSLESPFGELLPAFMTVINGKVKRLNSFYSARDKTIDFYRKPQINFIQQYKDDGSFEERFRMFSEPLIQEYSKLYGCDVRCSESVRRELLLFFKIHQSRKYVIGLNRLFGKNLVYGYFSRGYVLMSWLLFDLFKLAQLNSLTKKNEDYRRIKWFVKHCPVTKMPSTEVFVK